MYFEESRTIAPEFPEKNVTSTKDIDVKLNKEPKKIDVPVKGMFKLIHDDELDIVEHPDHYGAGKSGLQCIEAMLQTFGKADTLAFCKLNAFKYIWRSKHKGKENQDMEKAKRYMEYWHVLNKLQGDTDEEGIFHTFLNS